MALRNELDENKKVMEKIQELYNIKVEVCQSYRGKATFVVNGVEQKYYAEIFSDAGLGELERFATNLCESLRIINTDKTGITFRSTQATRSNDQILFKDETSFQAMRNRILATEKNAELFDPAYYHQRSLFSQQNSRPKPKPDNSTKESATEEKSAASSFNFKAMFK